MSLSNNEWAKLGLILSPFFWVIVVMLVAAGAYDGLVFMLGLIGVIVAVIVGIVMLAGHPEEAGKFFGMVETMVLGPFKLLTTEGAKSIPVLGKIASAVEHVVLEVIAESKHATKIGEAWDAIDPFKLGAPITEGEADYINYVVTREYYGEGHEHRSAGSLAEVYHDELKAEFGVLRRGWLAEYMGDAFAQNAGQRMVFLILVRTFLIGDAISGLRSMLEGHRNSPSSPFQMITASVIWMPFFFYLGHALLNAVLMDPLALLQPDAIPLVFAFMACFAKWGGSYGWWLPVFGTQTFVSALATALQYVMIFAVIFNVFNIQPTPFIPFGPFQLPAPWYFGLGNLIPQLAWSTILTVLGVAGALNIYYGEYVEYQRQGKIGHKLNRIENELLSQREN